MTSSKRKHSEDSPSRNLARKGPRHAGQKSLAEYSPSEKAQWRAYEDDPIRFTGSLSWLPGEKDFVVSTALTELIAVKALVEGPESEQTVRWSLLPLSPKAELPDALCDDLICCWLEIKDLDFELLPEHAEEYIKLLRLLLPMPIETTPIRQSCLCLPQGRETHSRRATAQPRDMPAYWHLSRGLLLSAKK